MRTPEEIWAAMPRDADGVWLPFEGDTDEQIIEQIAVALTGGDPEQARFYLAIERGEITGDVVEGDDE